MPTPVFLLRLLRFVGDWKGKHNGPEDTLVLAEAANLAKWTLEGRLRAVWTKIQPEAAYVGEQPGSHAANIARVRVGKARAMGAITGAWEFWFVWQGGGGIIEFKSETGRLTEEQKAYGEWAAYTGVLHAIVRRPGELAAVLKEWGVLRI